MVQFENVKTKKQVEKWSHIHLGSINVIAEGKQWMTDASSVSVSSDMVLIHIQDNKKAADKWEQF